MTPTIAAYAASMRAWGASPATIKARLIVVDLIGRDLADPTLTTRADIEQWLSNPDWAPATRAAYACHARAWFAWLTETGIIAASPMRGVRPPRIPARLPRPLSARELAAIHLAAPDDLRPLITLGLYAGLRASEAAAIKGSDIGDTLHVVGKGRKVAELPIHDSIRQLAETMPLGHWFPGGRGRVHIQGMTVTKWTTTLFRSLGIDGSYHRFRHTFGTNLARVGTPSHVIRELMRHESLTTTQGYIEVTSDARSSAIAALAA